MLMTDAVIADHNYKISIVLVVYNGHGHIRTALESFAQISYPNLELIVIDGGSSDGTLDVLAEFSRNISILVSEPDQGIYDAMNKACKLASGDWLMFMGCDDRLLNTVGVVADSLKDLEAVYYGDVVLRSSGKIYGGLFSALRLIKQNICHQALFYPRSVYKKYAYSMQYKWLADYAYNMQLIRNGIKFNYLGIVISVFNDKGASSAGDAEFDKDRRRLMIATFGHARVWLDDARKYLIMKYYLCQHRIKKLYRIMLLKIDKSWKKWM